MSRRLGLNELGGTTPNNQFSNQHERLSVRSNRKANELEGVLILLINLVIDFELSLVYLIIRSKYRER